jgi:hypothetical protein
VEKMKKSYTFYLLLSFLAMLGIYLTVTGIVQVVSALWPVLVANGDRTLEQMAVTLVNIIIFFGWLNIENGSNLMMGGIKLIYGVLMITTAIIAHHKRAV